MTNVVSVTFDRSSLLLEPLVIDSDPFAGDFHLPEDEVGRAARTMRRTYAPASAYIPGSWLLAAVEDAGSLPLSIYAHAATTADLEVAMLALEAATSQFAYDLTLTVDGVSRTYAADPELPSWGSIDSGMVRACLVRASIVIPVNPA